MMFETQLGLIDLLASAAMFTAAGALWALIPGVLRVSGLGFDVVLSAEPALVIDVPYDVKSVRALEHHLDAVLPRQIEDAKKFLTFNMGGSLTTSVAMIWGRD